MRFRYGKFFFGKFSVVEVGDVVYLEVLQVSVFLQADDKFLMVMFYVLHLVVSFGGGNSFSHSLVLQLLKSLTTKT